MNGEEEGKLPDLQDAVLNDEQLGQLFRDYHRCIDVLQIVVKQGRGRVADGEVNSPSLEEAEHLDPRAKGPWIADPLRVRR
jgi:hypothetical protein